MSFLAPFLLALSVFASIPILLHLIRRKRVRVLELPTFRYLKKAAERQRVRFHLQDQLLMVLRILVLLLLALAFAGPIGGERAGTTTGPVVEPKNLIILDDTQSMSIPLNEGITAYESAVRFVLELIWESPVDWKLGLASDFMGQRDPVEFLASGYEETVDLLERNPTPEAKGSIDTAIEKAMSLLDDQTSLWVVSDGAASNWPRASERKSTSTARVELIQVQLPKDLSNWGLTSLSLNNQPLMENEPALLSSEVESYGEGSQNSTPPSIRFGFKSDSGVSVSDGLQPTADPTNPIGHFSLESTLPTEGTIASVSASLDFREGTQDAFIRDNQAVLVPRFLEGVKILIVTESEEWGKILKSALVGIDTGLAETAQPPAQDAGTYSTYVVLLGKETPHKNWIDFLKQRVRSGAGALFLYDAQPEPVRIQTWTGWWTEWQEKLSLERLSVGPKTYRPGEADSFDRSLDPTARDSDWAEGEFEVVLLEGWVSELEIDDDKGMRVPVFQTKGLDQGSLAVWGVPLSPRETPLLYSTAWVPLFSQMVKRTLIDPKSFVPSHLDQMRVESKIASLSDAQKADLSGAGYRFYALDEVSSRIGVLAEGRRNWTVLILAACLFLALIEIGVSNYV